MNYGNPFLFVRRDPAAYILSAFIRETVVKKLSKATKHSIFINIEVSCKTLLSTVKPGV